MSAIIYLDRRDREWTADDVEHAEEPRFRAATLHDLSQAVQAEEGTNVALEARAAFDEDLAALIRAARDAHGDTRQRLIVELAENSHGHELSDADVHTLVEGF